MPRHERLQLGDELGVPAEREVGLDPVLERGYVHLVEARDLVLGKALVGEIRQREAAPECQRLPELLARRLRIAGGERRAAVRHAALEAVAVELVRLEPQHVAVAHRPQCLRAAGELLAQRRDAVLQHFVGGLGRRFAPQLVDEHVPGQRLVPVEQEECEDGALPRPAQAQGALAVECLERAEDPVLHLVLNLHLDYRAVGAGERPVAWPLPPSSMLGQS